jgi:hypothetical protein
MEKIFDFSQVKDKMIRKYDEGIVRIEYVLENGFSAECVIRVNLVAFVGRQSSVELNVYTISAFDEEGNKISYAEENKFFREVERQLNS